MATDDDTGLFAEYPNFDMDFERHPRGLKVVLKNAPAQAFVDGVLIETIHDHLFSVLRDLLHSRDLGRHLDQLTGSDSADLVFQILRNAKVLDSTENCHALSAGAVTALVNPSTTMRKPSVRN